MCLSNWRAKARTLRSVKALRDKVTENRIASDLRRRLRRWQQFALVSIALRKFVYRRDFELMRLVFGTGFQQFVVMKHKERDLIRQIGCVHEAFLKEGLARQIQQRMSVIAACEEIRRAGWLKRLLTAAWGEWMNFHSRKQAQQAAVRQLRVRVSRLEDVDSPLNTTRLAGMLRRWQTFEMTRVFDRWSDVTQAMHQTRLDSLKAIDLWHKTQCGLYFRGWVGFCHQQRQQRLVRAMNARSKMKRTWTLWRMFTAHSLTKKAASLDARQLHAQRVYKSAFETWRAVATSLRSKRAQILELYHSSRLRLLAALLGEWRQFAAVEKTKRMQSTAARVVYEDKLTRRSFTEWKTNVDGICYHRRQLQINTERLQVLLLCSSFRAWHAWSDEHKKLRAVVQIQSSKRNSRAVSRVFTTWHLHAEKTTRTRHQASSFLRFRRMQNGVKALRSVVQERQYLREMRHKAQRFRAAVSSSQVSIVFTHWKKLAARSHKTRSAALRWEKAFLRKVWDALVLAHNVDKQRHAVVHRAELHHRSYRLRKALTQWSHIRVETQHFRAVCEELLSRWRRRTACRCLCALGDHAAYHKTLRASEAAVRGKRRSTAMLQAWYAWRKLILVSRAGRRRLLQRYLTAWIRSHESRQALQALQRQIQTRVFCSLQRRCIATWTQFVATQKIEKATVLMLNAFAATQRMKRVWVCWVKFVGQRRATKSRMRNALAHAQLQRQLKAFRALQTHTLQQQWKTHARVRATALRSHRLRAQSFSVWRAVAVDRISRRCKLARYLEGVQYSVQTRSFSAWQALTARRKVVHEKVSQSLALRTQRCSRVVFQTWKSFVMKARKNRKARDFSAAKTSAHAIKHWKQYVVLCNIERMISVCEQRQVESSFLSWRNAVAVTQQIRAFRVKSARRHWIELVGMVFKAWRLRSRTHAHCRKLLTSVAVGSHLRFRFELWQKFTAHRKRLANLLLVVADPPALVPVDTPAVAIEDTASLEVETMAEGEAVGVHSKRGDNGEAQTSADDRQLVSLGQALAKKARVLQRFEVTWDLPQAWHRWRQIFHAQLFYRMRRLQLHFICWQRFIHQQRRNRWIVLKLTRQRQAASAQTVFRAWRELVARVKNLRKDRVRERELWVLVTTEMARRERRQLKTHWRAWKFHVGEARHLQASLDAYHRARLLTKYWLVWCHDFRQVVCEAHREAQRVKAHMNVFHCRRVLGRLRDNQQRTKRARLVLEYFGNRQYDTLLPEVLARWRKWCQREKEVARYIAEFQLRRTQRHFSAWKGWENTRRWQRVAVDNLQSKSVERRRRDVWMRWRRFVKKQVVKDLALQKALIFHVCIRLRRRWLRRSQRAVQLREQAEAAHMQLCVFRGHRAVRRWHDFSRARRLRRLCKSFVLRKHIQLWQSAVKHAVATRFGEFVLRFKAKKMLVAWRQAAARQQHWRQLCGSFVDKQETRTAQHSLLRWQQFVNAQQGNRLAAMHAEQRILRNAWRYWSHAAMATQLLRCEQLQQAVEHEAVTLLRQSISVWQAAVKKQRERRFVLLSCVVKLKSVAAQRIQDVVFSAWRRLVERQHRCRAALLKRDCNAAKRALIFWLAWTRDRQRRRKQLGSAANYHSQRLKSAVFFYWQTYALAWQDAAKPLARRHDRPPSQPAKVVTEPWSSDIFEDSDDSDADVRRPTSPVMKRLRQKKTKRTRAVEAGGESTETVALCDAVEISMDVKKRLLLLGKWRRSRRASSCCLQVEVNMAT
ncbi:hypothetical protein PR001_g14038 [Phytophthora rubi]|nr:hypothetical protein PR001_g14038 [Phytophthora rubi]